MGLARQCAARATIEAKLASPDYKVEIMVVAPADIVGLRAHRCGQNRRGGGFTTAAAFFKACLSMADVPVCLPFRRLFVCLNQMPSSN